MEPVQQWTLRRRAIVSTPLAELPQGPLEPNEVELREANRVITAAACVHGDATVAAIWFRNERLSTFAFKTAQQLVREGRTEDVLSYLTSLDAGATG